MTRPDPISNPEADIPTQRAARMRWRLRGVILVAAAVAYMALIVGLAILAWRSVG